jgi:hypothetical protein
MEMVRNPALEAALLHPGLISDAPTGLSLLFWQVYAFFFKSIFQIDEKLLFKHIRATE